MTRRVPEKLCDWTTWVHLGEFCYNTTFHLSIGMSPFKALYGYDAPNFADLIFGDCKTQKAKDWLQESQNILKTLKDNLLIAQNQQKLFVDKQRVERTF